MLNGASSISDGQPLMLWLLVFVFISPSPSICIIMGEGDCLLLHASLYRTDDSLN